MIVLTVSDILIPFIYSPQIGQRFSHVDLVIDCGDSPYYYLEYISSALNVPVYFVRGNHAKEVEYTTLGPRTSPAGGIDLHRKVINYNGLLLAGIEGSGRYREGPFQYTQSQMWRLVFGLVPGLLVNRLRYGRYLDLFITHAPPWGVHDQPDLPHQGIKAFRWLDRVFKPDYHIHGHIHVYRPDTVTNTQFGCTQVINTYGYKLTDIKVPGWRDAGQEQTRLQEETPNDPRTGAAQVDQGEPIDPEKNRVQRDAGAPNDSDLGMSGEDQGKPS